MKRKILTITLTLLVLLGLSMGITYFTHVKFADYSFFIGLAATIIIGFFTSKGGYGTRQLDMTIQGSTGIRMESQKFNFSPHIVFITSVAYTIVTLVVMLFQYRGYF